MNLSQLYYFQHLAEVQHYTHAAEDLFITQPALSHSISALEDELGCTLFQKDGRNVRLTEDGRLFKTYVDQGLGAIDHGVAEIKGRHGMLTGTIDIGAIATVRSLYLPAAMTAYREKNGPLVEFRVYQGETTPLEKQLKSGAYDLVLAGPMSDSELTRVPLFHQPLAIVVSKMHPLAEHSSITYDDLKGYDVITYREGIAIGDCLTDFFKKTGAPVNELKLTRNYEDEVILGAMAMNEGVVALAVITTNLLPVPEMVIVPLDVPGADEFYPIVMSYRTKSFRTPAAQGFIEFLKTFVAPTFTHPNEVKNAAPEETASSD